MKILAVDNDPFVLDFLSEMAAKADFPEISTAASGEVVLDMLRNENISFDCLLLDISLPGMDGIELCSLARKIPAYSKIPIIILNARTERDFINRAFGAGATDYVKKPLDITVFQACLRMAKKLWTTLNETAAHATGIDGGELPNADEHSFALSHEISIHGIKYLIRYMALANYMNQIPEGDMVCSQVVGIKIDTIERIYTRASEEEFLYILTQTADAISNTFRRYDYMMAYTGSGVFIVVAGKENLETSVELEDKIQNLLDGKVFEYGNGESLTISISVGNPVRLSKSRTQRVRNTFDRAIVRTESRVLRKHNVPRSRYMRLING
ncbi:response regulator [Loktanella sp. DJP18]|uniref:response regulator n=1 Tax=Loktanella sp. DJP18 TaxID=3409788 RepID=UPI003BB62A26